MITSSKPQFSGTYDPVKGGFQKGWGLLNGKYLNFQGLYHDAWVGIKTYI